MQSTELVILQELPTDLPQGPGERQRLCSCVRRNRCAAQRASGDASSPSRLFLTASAVWLSLGPADGKVLAVVAIAWLIQQRMGSAHTISILHHALPLSLCTKGITAPKTQGARQLVEQGADDCH